jgi:two-component system osmolarity sensor histidine kinase EnvZ
MERVPRPARSRAESDRDSGRFPTTIKSDEFARIRFVAGGKPYWLVVFAVRPPFPPPILMWVLTALVVSSSGAYFLISRLNRQLRVVVEASRTIARGEAPAAIAVEGPDETELSRGFNQMSESLQRLDADRRLMLAGISHDLRTPLVRLRLNVELNEQLSPLAAAAMVRDIKEIDAVLGQFLEFARNEADEPAQQSDLNALVADVCALAACSAAMRSKRCWDPWDLRICARGPCGA